jgi:2-polyprenyl-3-methyl-5-hydroxy-6-metoxy-1,4-benzoquinol methylase
MNRDLNVLRDPDGGEPLTLDGDTLRSTRHEYPVVRGIPRFVNGVNYSQDFGKQWNRYAKTQLDSHTGLDLTETRLARCVPEALSELAGKRVLEAGSGAGRFTEILLRHGAIVHSFDFSSAVEANAGNNGASERLTLVQADIRHIPYEKASYDYVICLGVLQHTPDPEESVRCLWEMVKPGGHLVIDHYRWQWRSVLPPPIGGAGVIVRQVALRLPDRSRSTFVDALTRFWFPIHWSVRDSVMLQRVLRRLSPVHFYYPHLGLKDRAMYYEWALLDTHDATTDVYRHLRTPAQIRTLLASLGGQALVVRVGGNGVEASCMKPLA